MVRDMVVARILGHEAATVLSSFRGSRSGGGGGKGGVVSCHLYLWLVGDKG